MLMSTQLNSRDAIAYFVEKRNFREIRTVNKETGSPSWCTPWEIIALRPILNKLSLEPRIFRIDCGYAYEYGSGNVDEAHLVIVPVPDENDHDFMFLKLKLADTNFTLSEEYDVETFSDKYFSNNIYRPPIKIIGLGC